MISCRKSGFTIIETMLFLAISGLLVMGILASAGTSINTQRYRDSVNSLQSVLQKQYSDVINVSNEHDSSWSCDSSNAPTQSGTGTYIGQSDCVLLGKYIRSNDDGSGLIVKDVVGHMPSVSTSFLSETEIFLKNGNGSIPGYNIQVSQVSQDDYSLEWNASMVQKKPNSSQKYALSMLILRSPNSGTILTFISTNSTSEVADGNITDMINTDSLKQTATICVSSNGLFTGTRMAVFINANSSNSSGVETLGDNSGC